MFLGIEKLALPSMAALQRVLGMCEPLSGLSLPPCRLGCVQMELGHPLTELGHPRPGWAMSRWSWAIPVQPGLCPDRAGLPLELRLHLLGDWAKPLHGVVEARAGWGLLPLVEGVIFVCRPLPSGLRELCRLLPLHGSSQLPAGGQTGWL